MKFDILKHRDHFIGLHLNAHAIKMLQFRIRSRKTFVQAFSNLPLPKGQIVNDSFANMEAVSEQIKKAMERPQKGAFTTKNVVTSIPESKSFIRSITMQKMTEDEIQNAIVFEAEAYIPLPMDQVYFDWQILSEKNGKLEILLVASPKDYVDKLMEVVEQAGLRLCGIETEAHSVARALVPPEVEEPVLLVDIDALKTALIITQAGTLQFTSSIPIAGNIFTERLAKAANLTVSEAERVKRKYGFANTAQHPNLKTQMLPAVEDLAHEIKNIIKFHYSHNKSHISQLVLTGGGAKLQHLSDTMQGMFDEFQPLHVTVANPMEYIPNLKEQVLTPYEALSFTTAIGLAMWEMHR